MLDLYVNAYQYASAMMPTLEKICAPLCHHLAIKNVGYIKFLNDGKFLHLSNNQETMHIVFELAYHNRYVFEVGHELRRKPKYLLVAHQESDLKKPLYSYLHSINMWKGFYLYNWENNYVEYLFFFGNPQWSDDSENLFLNNLPLFEHFFNYFKVEARHIISPEKNSQYGLIRSNCIFNEYLNKKDFNTLKNLSFDSKVIHSFFRDTKIKKYYFDIRGCPLSLSRREAQTVYYLLHGKTTKQMAVILGLSPRTIEHYIDNIKKKTELTHKTDIVSFFEKTSLKSFMF